MEQGAQDERTLPPWLRDYRIAASWHLAAERTLDDPGSRVTIRQCAHVRSCQRAPQVPQSRIPSSTAPPKSGLGTSTVHCQLARSLVKAGQRLSTAQAPHTLEGQGRAGGWQASGQELGPGPGHPVLNGRTGAQLGPRAAQPDQLHMAWDRHSGEGQAGNWAEAHLVTGHPAPQSAGF